MEATFCEDLRTVTVDKYINKLIQIIQDEEEDFTSLSDEQLRETVKKLKLRKATRKD